MMWGIELPPTLSRAAATVITVVAVASSGCTAGQPDDAGSRIKPGVCVAKEAKDQGNLVPDLTSIVACKKPHVYEVYDIIDLPRAALTGTTRQERKDNRDDLALPHELPQDSAQRTAYEKFAETECATSLQRVTGYDEVHPGGVKAANAHVIPAMLGVTPGYSVMPEKEWLDGRQQVVCSARFDDLEAKGSGRRPTRARSAPSNALLISSVRSPSFPLEFRPCRAYDKTRKKVSLSRCTRPHVAEILFSFEADAVFDKKFLKRLRKNATPKLFDRFDRVCAETFTVLLGEGYDKKTLRGFGSVPRRWSGNNTPVRCDVGPKQFRTKDLRAGSLVGTGAARIDLLKPR